ncbi:hypothetical protein C0J52_04102, partial [Blattella germanica]
NTFTDPDFLPTFDLRDLPLETSSDESSSEDDDFAVSMEISQGWPILKLPILLLPKTQSTSDGEEYHLLHAIQGRRIYSQLPPDLRDAVMMTLKLNNSIDEFFRKSVWRYYLRLKR